MPGTLEAVVILIVLAGPGFIASRLLNSLVAYRLPTAFQETTQAVVFSAVMVPIWLLAAQPLIAARNAMLAVWRNEQATAELPWWAIWMPILIFAVVYFVAAPLVAVVWAFFVRTRPHVRLAQAALRKFGLTVRADEGPEVWDAVFGSADTQRWVRICYKDGTAIEGVLVAAGVSPAGRQLHLAGLDDVPHSLTVLDSGGNVTEDLSSRQVQSLWLEITADVQRVEVYSS